MTQPPIRSYRSSNHLNSRPSGASNPVPACCPRLTPRYILFPVASRVLAARIPTGATRKPTGTAAAISAPPSQCLDAFVIALNHGRCDGEKWYASTLQLQLASLPLCAACRSASTLHLTVETFTPRSVWSASDATGGGAGLGAGVGVGAAPAAGNASETLSQKSGRTTVATRVPRFRARGVRWKLPATKMTRASSDALANVEYLFLGSDFTDEKDRPTDDVERITWPRRLKRLVFDHHFDRPIERVTWPASLRQLTFGNRFDQPIRGVAWPGSLQQLIFGMSFDQRVDGVEWPASLEQLVFGRRFNQPISGTSWPASLLELTFGGNFHQPVEMVVFPAWLQQVSSLGLFDQAIENVIWPSSLLRLTFGDDFSQPIERVAWPTSLRQVVFGYRFDYPIERVVWPTSLQKLSFGYSFNQPIDGVVWPASLQQLTFGDMFDQPIENVSWPASLLKLTLGHQFSYPTTYLCGLGLTGEVFVIRRGPRNTAAEL